MNTVEIRELIWVESRDTAQEVVEFGRQHGMTFKLVDRHDERYVYYPIDELPQGFHIPNEAHRRLELVGSNFPIQGIIVADDREAPPTFGEVAKKVGKVALAATGVIATAVAVVGVAVASAILYDPKLIIVIDGQWISIAEWL